MKPAWNDAQMRELGLSEIYNYPQFFSRKRIYNEVFAKMLNFTVNPTQGSVLCPTNGILMNADVTYQAENYIDCKNRHVSASVEGP